MKKIVLLLFTFYFSLFTATAMNIGKFTGKLDSDRMTPEALWAMGRISAYQVSPDGKQVVYQVGYYSVAENKSHHVLYVMNIDGSNQTLLTQSEKSETDPAWIEGGKKIAYLAGGQLWSMNADGTERKQMTNLEMEVEGYLFSPDETKVILLHSLPYTGSIEAKPQDLPKTSGMVINDMNYRHWDHYVKTITHAFVYEVESGAKGVDILEGEPYECPMAPFGGVEQLAWSPDSKTIAYTCRKKEGVQYAISTDSDIYLYNIHTRETKNLCKPAGYVEPAIDATKSLANQPINHLQEDCNVGYDTNPQFSPDGTQIAWLSMERCGYESDRNRLCVYTLATGKKEYVTEQLDSPVDAFVWSKDKDAQFYFTSVWHATENIYKVTRKGEVVKLTDFQADFGSIQLVPGTKKTTLLAERHDYFNAADLYLVEIEGGKGSSSSKGSKGSKGSSSSKGSKVICKQITQENEQIMSQLKKGTVEPHWCKTSTGEDLHYWAVLPPDFDPNKKYPTLLFCEGGPQSPVSQFWSYRWNFMIMASQGYVVIAPNRHGLPGFGTKWCEQVSGDWTGQVMNDYLAAIDDACATLPYVDKDRLGCVGASFGGFSVYYLAGHHNKRFKAFIAHDGAFNLEAMYTDTEEAWFSNWEYEDAYWNKNLSLNAKRTYENSPHRFIDKWDTPILCIHGELDYRINANQGFGAFNAAKMQGVPAQLLLFPDENHWVLKPQNGVLWQRTFFGWLKKWL